VTLTGTADWTSYIGARRLSEERIDLVVGLSE
jgi:hypothetical protein